MRLAGLALVVALLALPPAAAGSEEDPEVLSPRDRDEPQGDLLAVWLEDDPRGVKITFQTARLSAREARVVWYLALDVDGTRVTPTVGFDGNGRLQSDSGDNPGGWGNGRVDNALRIDRVTRGEPGEVSVVIPWGVYGLQRGSELTPRFAASALCCNPRGDAWISPYDQANARSASYVVTDTGIAPVDDSLFPILVPAWVIPTIVVGCVAGGMGGGLLLARSTRRAPAAPATPAAPARPPVPPPGERFRREPPTRQR